MASHVIIVVKKMEKKNVMEYGNVCMYICLFFFHMRDLVHLSVSRDDNFACCIRVCA